MLFKDKDAPNQTSYTLLNSLIASFILKTLYDGFINLLHIDCNTSSPAYFIIMFALCLICGYIGARYMQSEYGQNFRDEFKIKRTVNENIWRDVIKPDIWMKVWLPGTETSYYGQVKYTENYPDESLVVLEYYQILDKDDNVLVDNTSNPKYTVVLNLAKSDRVEIVER